ncbi:tripartite motif-containing protein 46-like [Liolophura sinensis]|uniref:tripartite motif-containing protein 46-like n=1 Tax=Liolophura sinensis TaxID=3198878 RepID=UPI0031583F10
MGNGDVHQLIACPVCRAPTSLGREGVAGLPPNFHLADAVEKFSSAVKVEDDIPYCSACEENNQAEAIKFCTTFCMLYCKVCLASYHPMRGGFKHRSVISAQEYLAQKAPEAQTKTDKEWKHKSACTRYHQPICMYCEPCQAVMCVGCVVKHPGNVVRDIQSAVDIDKPAVVTKTSELEEVLKQIEESLSSSLHIFHYSQLL